MMRTSIRKNRLHALPSRGWSTGVLPALALGLIVYTLSARSIETDRRVRFDNVALNTRNAIDSRIRSYTGVLCGTASLFESQHNVTRAQCHRYVANLHLPDHVPAIEVVNFARHVVNAAQLPAFVHSCAPNGVRAATHSDSPHVWKSVETSHSYPTAMFTGPTNMI